MKEFRLVIAGVCMALVCVQGFPQATSKYQRQAIMVKRVIEKNHYSPRPVDDAFSAAVFDHMLERLDADKLYFLEQDIKKLSAYRLKIDDELSGKGWGFLDELSSLYKKRLQKADSTVLSALQKPFDLSVNEVLSLSPDSLHYPGSEKEYQEKWRKWLKYETLDMLEDAILLAGTNAAGDKKLFTDREAEARQKVKIMEQRSIKKILDNPSGFENYMATLFCDIIANNFDPHTEYFPPAEKDQFLTGLNSDGLYYGFSVVENDKGDLEISNLMPGSSAWKTGELNKGDVLLQLGFENKPVVDLAGASPEEAMSFLDGAGNVRLQLTVKKTNGIVKTVSLVKEKIRNDDNVVKSFVLKGDKKIGYISLPGFYSNEEDENAANCANDVAKEIVLLKKENIDALILDLRYNGGGSLSEALNMAGIFIDDGPLAIYKDKTGKTSTLKDANRGTIYDGPLLLLVNGTSASASELLAAVLQDYHRAIIAGGTTYGKGSAQTIIPLDTSRESPGTVITDKNPEFGYVKVTGAKFFRVTGNTTQYAGVKSDIPLPDIFDALDYREANSPAALPADTVKRNSYYKALPALPIAELAAKSQVRVANNKAFGTILKMEELIRASGKQAKAIPLQWDKYESINKTSDKMSEEKLQAGMQVKGEGYQVDNTTPDKEFLKKGNFETEINNRWLKRLQQDVYIEEAVHILIDYINLLSRKN